MRLQGVRDSSVRSGTVYDESSVRLGGVYRTAGGSGRPESLLLNPSSIKIASVGMASLNGSHRGSRTPPRNKQARAIPDSEKARGELWHRRLDPAGRVAAACDWAAALCVAWAAVLVPLRLAFQCDAPFWRALDAATDFALLLELLVRAHVAHASAGRLALSRWANLRAALGGWRGAARLLALAPALLLPAELALAGGPAPGPFLVIRLLRLARVPEALALGRALEASRALALPLAVLLRHLLLLALQAHWSACAWFAIGRYAEEGEGPSWLGETAPGVREDSTAGQYVASLYFAVGALAAVGLGDIHAAAWRERLFCVCLFAVNFALVARALADTLGAAVWGRQRAGAFRERMGQLESLMAAEAFPPALRARLATHFALAEEAAAPAAAMLEGLPYRSVRGREGIQRPIG
eukprot:tig00000073_g1702.t1